MTNYRPTFAEIDLDAIRGNVRALRATITAPHALAVVKANAYGHGDVPVAKACLEAGADWLAVALVEEGVRLREAGIDAPILTLIEPTPDAAKELIAQRITPSVFGLAAAHAVSEAAVAAGTAHPVHVCVDTGMHREGTAVAEAAGVVESVARLPGLVVEGLWSHFAVSDEETNPFTSTQLERFAGVCEAVARKGIDIPIRHIGNSVTAMALEDANLDLVRMGIAMYGLYPAPWLERRVSLRPAMRLVSAVGNVHHLAAGEGVSYGHEYTTSQPTTIATVLIGYADGYPRPLSNKASVLVGAKRRRLAGRVTMDQIMVDCGSDDVGVGDEAVLIGSQNGEEITAGELADLVGTIHYEVVCGVSARVPRTYTG